MKSALKIISRCIVLALLALLSACVKQQAGLRLVYVPAPPQPALPPTPDEQGSVTVIQEPPRSQPAQPSSKRQQAQVLQPPEPLPLPPPPVLGEEPAPAVEPSQETAAPPAGQAPQLIPQGVVQKQAALRQRVRSLNQAIQQRLNRLSRANLSPADRKALQDAGMFLTQADAAIKEGDLQQSLNLVQKADLLVSAVGARH